MSLVDTKLEGWKAIADHLGRDPRTAQRWQRERGMPVHRVPGNRGGAVFAYRDELDRWLTAGAQAQGSSPLVTEFPKPAVVPTQGDDSEQLPTSQAQRKRPFSVFVVTAVLLLAATLLKTRSPAASVSASEWQINGTVLAALDADRKMLWSFELPEGREAGEAGIRPGLERAAPVDLNADGDIDAVATVNYIDAQGRIGEDARVYYLGTAGDLLWRYRPHRSLTFAGRQFTGPWRVYGAVAAGRDHIWVSFIHRTWWPSFVVSLGADGADQLALVNAGHIEALQTVEAGGREHVLAGGFNNEFMLPALAAFEARGATVVSPQTAGTPFVCDSCPPERPLVYMVFPRSDVNVALGSPFISVADIEKPDDTGTVEVSVRDVPHATREIYRVSTDVVPQSVAFSDRHWTVHRELSAAGKLDHVPEECPARLEGVTVRVWQTATGWKDVVVAPMFTATRPE